MRMMFCFFEKLSQKNPFAEPKMWVDIAKTLNNLLKAEKDPTVRTVKDRITLLMKKFFKSETESKKASGIVEEETEYTNLLREAYELEQEAEESKNTEKSAKKEAAAAIRQAAMITFTAESDDSDSENEPPQLSPQTSDDDEEDYTAKKRTLAGINRKLERDRKLKIPGCNC